MREHTTKRGLALGAAGLVAGATVPGLARSGVARAQGLSTRPVSVIAPYAAGAPPDILARVLADALQRRWNQPFVVENRPGASGNVGTQAAVRAAPDGQTLLISAGTIAMNVSLFRNITYDPVRDLAPIMQIASLDLALFGNPGVGATMGDFLEQARRHPGRLNYATPGVGTPHHVAMELLKRQTGIQVEHVPYRGLPAALSDLIAGNVAVMFSSIPFAADFARDGRLRILAVASEVRVPQAPGVPTMAEAGVPGMIMRDWFGIFAPARTPADIIRRYNEALNGILTEADVIQAISAQGMMPIGGPPERLRDRLATDLSAWARVIREAGIVAD